MASGQRRCAGCGLLLSRYNADTRCATCTRASARDAHRQPCIPEWVWRDADVIESLAKWDFGAAFHRIRQIAHLRQEDLASLTGLSQSYLSALESGTRRLTHVEKIKIVLRGLGVPQRAAPELVATDLSSRLHGATTEAVHGTVWESPVEVARRLHAAASSNTDGSILLVLRETIEGVVHRYEAEGPYSLAGEVLEVRRYVGELLEGRQLPRQREALFRLAAQASALLAYMAVNAGREVLAEAYCAEAAELASHIDDRELVMWIQGTRSLNAYYAGRFEQAVACADAGVAIDPGHPQAIRLQANGRARALGKLGDVTGAERAIAAALDLSARHDVADGLTPCISFVPYALARTLANAATVHVALRSPHRVLAYADEIDDRVEQSDSAWSRALVRLDVATAVLTSERPDVEQAMVLGRQILEADGGAPIRSVVQRAGDLYLLAAPWRHLPAVREYGEALRVWQSAPQARALVGSAKLARPVQPTRRAADAAHSRFEGLPAQPPAEHD
ncbi:helix-turn-helix transcriptional regulator [Streptomyces melanogenes]|uniref:helix-turn-helix domain-containing protein n=1 Tax=Streptomyces melanogenes TaxID=67326 RepID=UPI002E32068C|nr:helix-turn-helix transcriptional regulator [Streptomyces melanogenes]